MGVINEERVNMVKEWAKANPKPVHGLCPEINQWFRTTKGVENYNYVTGERKVLDFDPSNSWNAWRRHGYHNGVTPRTYDYEGFYVRNVEELNALEIAKVIVDAHRGKNGELKEWYYGGSYYRNCDVRYFLFKGDDNVYRSDGSTMIGNGHYSKDFLNTLHYMSDCFVDAVNYHQLLAFDSNIDFNSYGQWHSDTDKHYMYEYERWYKMHFVPRNVSQKAKDLASYELESIDRPTTQLNDVGNVIIFQQLDDNYGVLRCFRYANDSMFGVPWEEKCRLFVDTKGKATVMEPVMDTWQIKSSLPYGINCETMVFNAEEMMEWKPLRYIWDCVKEDPKLANFVRILRHPVVEQLAKAGYPHIAKWVGNGGTVAANLRDYFGVEKERKLPFFKLLGVNKFVLNAAEKCGDNCLAVIKEIKKWCGQFDCTKMDEPTCEAIASYIGNVRGWGEYKTIDELVPGRRHAYYYRSAAKLSYAWSNPLTDEERKWVTKLLRLEAKTAGCCQLYKDAVSSYNNLNNKPRIDLFNMHSFDDIRRFHDAILALKLEEDRERQALRDMREKERQEALTKKWEKLQEERVATYEWDGEENDNFVVRTPHSLMEIREEGLALSHCVGGYVEKHALGHTNILFLRHKDSPDIPFFTMEIANGEVIQIHGSHNRWLGTSPEAIPFVYRYLTQLGVQFDTKMLLSTAMGYGRGSEFLDESYLYAKESEVA